MNYYDASVLFVDLFTEEEVVLPITVFDFTNVPRLLECVNMNNYKKTPNEIVQLAFCFSNVLGDSENISSHTVICKNINNGADTKTVIVDSETCDDNTVTLILKAGDLNESHKITVRVSSSLNNAFEIDLFLKIAEDITDSFEKQPNSIFTISNDFKNESVTSDEIIITKISDNTDVTINILLSSLVLDGIVYITLQAGADKEFYRIAVRGLTDSGLMYEKFVLMKTVEV